MRFLKSTWFQFPNLLSTTCSFFSPAILLHRKWEGGVSVWCSYRQSKRSWVLRGSRLQDLRTWSAFQNFYLKNNFWEILQESPGQQSFRFNHCFNSYSNSYKSKNFEYVLAVYLKWEYRCQVGEFQVLFLYLRWDSAVLLSCKKVLLRSWVLKINLWKIKWGLVGVLKIK